MAEILTMVGTVLAAMVSWLGTVVDCFMGQPLLLLPIIIGMAYGAVKFVRGLFGF